MDELSELRKIARGAAAPLKTAASTVIDGLREAIIRGVLTTERPLRQEEIAEVFKVSRMPVREALRQLEAEGLVHSAPHRGAIVAELSVGEVKEIDAIRGALETLALRLSISRIHQNDINDAFATIEQMEESRGTVEWTALNEKLHMTLYRRAEAPRLLSLIAGQYASLARYTNLHLLVIDYDVQAEQHRSLVELCAKIDYDKAVEALSNHIRGSGEEFANFFSRLRSEDRS